MLETAERLAKRAYEIGLDSLIDEDLTQFFPIVFENPNFKFDIYTSINPREIMRDNNLFEIFLEYRKNKPYLWKWD